VPVVEFVSRHIQMPGDPLDVLIIELDVYEPRKLTYADEVTFRLEF
jgi:hypothetical protein